MSKKNEGGVRKKFIEEMKQRHTHDSLEVKLIN